MTRAITPTTRMMLRQLLPLAAVLLGLLGLLIVGFVWMVTT